MSDSTKLRGPPLNRWRRVKRENRKKSKGGKSKANTIRAQQIQIGAQREETIALKENQKVNQLQFLRDYLVKKTETKTTEFRLNFIKTDRGGTKYFEIFARSIGWPLA